MSDDYEGIPRKKISWFPRVDTGRCSGCGTCVEFCHREVYAIVDERAFVRRPYSCVVACTGCVEQCPENAISFPSLRELSKALRELRKHHPRKNR